MADGVYRVLDYDFYEIIKSRGIGLRLLKTIKLMVYSINDFLFIL